MVSTVPKRWILLCKPTITEGEKKTSKPPRCQGANQEQKLKIGPGPWGLQGQFHLGRLSPYDDDDDDDDDRHNGDDDNVGE